MERGERIYALERIDEDAGFQSVKDFWQERFGEPLDVNKAIHKEDRGDTFLYFMPNGYCYTLAYDGEYVHKTRE